MFGSIIYSVKKSFKLRKLELLITPSTQGKNTEQLYNDMFDKENNDKKDMAMHDFLDLCEKDSGVAKVMKDFSLCRKDLKDIYNKLVMSGCGGWYRGHYAALSTIAYWQPLLFYVTEKRKGTSDLEVAFTLLNYWKSNKQLSIN